MRKHKITKHKSMRYSNPDIAVLNLLKKFNLESSKLLPAYFYLYVDSKQNAEAAEKELTKLGFDVDVCRSAKPPRWLCLASIKINPRFIELNEFRILFSNLGSRYNGEYDGFELEVIPS